MKIKTLNNITYRKKLLRSLDTIGIYIFLKFKYFKVHCFGIIIKESIKENDSNNKLFSFFSK